MGFSDSFQFIISFRFGKLIYCTEDEVCYFESCKDIISDVFGNITGPSVKLAKITTLGMDFSLAINSLNYFKKIKQLVKDFCNL